MTTLLLAGAVWLAAAPSAGSWGELPVPAAAPSNAPKKGVSAYDAAIHISGKIGSRPAPGRGERRAHDYVAKRFEAAGLDVTVSPFNVPGRSRSRNVIGVLDTKASCL